MSNARSLIAELRRRNVIRMAGLYVVAAWLITQVTGTVLPMFDAPAWLPRSIVILLAVGFIPALIFAWVFELTPEGLKRDDQIKPEESIAPQTARRMDRMIIAVLIIALVYFAADKFALAPQREAAQRAPAVAASTGVVPSAAVSTSDPAAVPAKSIAVLPFVNMSGDPKNEYFSDGITEEILDALTQIPGLKVAARTSAFAFKGKDQDLRKVGETLGVANVLEGSVQSAGDSVRITAQLIDARNGFHLWSEKYDRKLTNVFAVEDEISKAIADHLKLTLQGAQMLVTQKTSNARAHDLYLRGLALLPARGPGLRETKSYFEQAVAIDPDYADAWAGISFIHVLLSAYLLEPFPEAIDQATEAAERALMLDPRSGFSHAAAASVYRNKMDFARAESEYREAIALNPGDAETYDQYAQMLSSVGAIEQAIDIARKSVALNPLSAHPRYTLGYVLEYGHRHAEAQAELRRGLELSPAISTMRMELALAYIGSGQFAEAEEQARIGARENNEDPELIATMIRAVANPALRADAIRKLDEGGVVGYYDLFRIAPGLWYSLLGARDKAIESIAKGLDDAVVGERYYSAQALFAPAFDSIRDDPRFKAILMKWGVPDRSAEHFPSAGPTGATHG
ncbi:MAG TPA: hypothetical protein VFI49_16240 [Rudaea sp.]|nr:hypothetical protein [Rudaea sp.]